jgi:hypothetical protein
MVSVTSHCFKVYKEFSGNNGFSYFQSYHSLYMVLLEFCRACLSFYYDVSDTFDTMQDFH